MIQYLDCKRTDDRYEVGGLQRLRMVFVAVEYEGMGLEGAEAA